MGVGVGDGVGVAGGRLMNEMHSAFGVAAVLVSDGQAQRDWTILDIGQIPDMEKMTVRVLPIAAGDIRPVVGVIAAPGFKNPILEALGRPNLGHDLY